MNTRVRARLRRDIVIATTISFVMLVVSTADAVIRLAEDNPAIVAAAPSPTASPSPEASERVEEAQAKPAKKRVRSKAKRGRRAAVKGKSQRRRAARFRPRAHRWTRKQRIGFDWPTHGIVTSRFGWRSTGFHHGMDIECARGSLLRSSLPGRVVFATTLPIYGRVAVIRHKRGFSTLYAHMYRLLTWGGQRVRRNQVIGLCGTSGKSTGPHVHFEIRKKGRHQNPRDYLRGRSI